MCEPEIVAGGRLPDGSVAPGTGLTVAEHQQRTVQSVIDLGAELAPDGLDKLIIPVLQGFAPDQYERCADLYAQAGIDLATERVVGLGSGCRRQADAEILSLARDPHADGMALHGFGVKTLGLPQLSQHLSSCDSMAWSMAARRDPRPISRDCDHRKCVTCPRYAMASRQRLLDGLRAPITDGGSRTGRDERCSHDALADRHPPP
jgi:hypothetical protein